MSKSLASIFGKKERAIIPSDSVDWPMPDLLTGIEVEIEGTENTYFPENQGFAWRITDDHSLQRGREYVLVAPLAGNQLTKAINALFYGAKIVRNVTSSTHIHIDMLESSTGEATLQTLTLLVFVLEAGIFALTERARQWCGYCNMLSTAPDAIVGAILNAKEEDGFSELSRISSNPAIDGNRYFGFNVLALAEHGSVEFRYFPTATSPEELIGWVKLCQSFKKAAIELNPEQLIRIINDDRLYGEFVEQYFSEWSKTFLQEVPQYAAVQNLRKALAIAGAHKGASKAKPFNTEAITKNKVLAKFAKNKKPKIEMSEIMIQPKNSRQFGQISSNGLKEGTILIMNNGSVAIIWQDRWNAAFVLEAFSVRVRQEMYQSIMNEMPSIEARLAMAGYIPAEIHNAMLELRSIIRWLEQEGEMGPTTAIPAQISDERLLEELTIDISSAARTSFMNNAQLGITVTSTTNNI